MDTKKLVEKYIDDLVYEVFIKDFSANTSINYYISKIWSDDPEVECPSIEDSLKQAIRLGILDDVYTYGDVDPEEYDGAIDLWNCLVRDAFPYPKLLSKFMAKNKHLMLGKLVRLARVLWKKEQIIWINASGCSPPYSEMQKIIYEHPNIKGCSAWYTQNPLLEDGTSTGILHNPCKNQKAKKGRILLGPQVL